MELAVLLIILDKPVLPIAIGLYLPFSLTIPIMLGGLVHHFVDKKVENRYGLSSDQAVNEKEKHSHMEKMKEKVHNKGILFSSGLIAGEALMGIVMAVFVVQGISLALIGEPIVILGVGFFLFLAYLLWRFGNQAIDEQQFK